MHLKKWFNFKYLYQNFKKSKSILIFLVCAVFFINLWLVGVNLLSGNIIIDFDSLSNISAVIAFILPVILAFSLFGFVFKRKEVDFIMSKPISRRQIYVSNIFGGIVYIFVIILLNTLGFTLLALFTDLFIPAGAIIDYFVFWLFTYIFVFIVSIVGISISGSRIGAIVIVALIILLYPCLSVMNESLKNNTEYKVNLVCRDEDCFPSTEYCVGEKCLEQIDNNEYIYDVDTMFTGVFTTPIDYYRDGFTNYSLIKTIILTIVYGVCGYFLFKHRKMENSDVSFKDNKVYQIVKLLTYIPVTYIAFYLWLNDNAFLLVSIIICIGYYFIYDLIMKKELKDIFKLISEILVYTALFVGIYFIVGLYNNNASKELDIPDEVKISMPVNNGYSNYPQEVVIDNKDLINELISLDGRDYAYQITIYLSDKYYIVRYITPEKYEHLLAEIDKKDIEPEFTEDNILHITSTVNLRTVIPATDEVKKLIVKFLNSSNTGSNEVNRYITIYKYENHELKTLSFDVANDLELLNYVKNYLNDAFLENFDGDLWGNDERLPEGYSIILRQHRDELLQYLEEHKYDELTEDSVILYSNLDRYYINRNTMEEFLMEYDLNDAGEDT